MNEILNIRKDDQSHHNIYSHYNQRGHLLWKTVQHCPIFKFIALFKNCLSCHHSCQPPLRCILMFQLNKSPQVLKCILMFRMNKSPLVLICNMLTIKQLLMLKWASLYMKGYFRKELHQLSMKLMEIYLVSIYWKKTMQTFQIKSIPRQHQNWKQLILSYIWLFSKVMWRRNIRRPK